MTQIITQNGAPSVEEIAQVISNLVNGRKWTGELIKDALFLRLPALQFDLDGVTHNLSIQASAYHYCVPREDTDIYEAVEIGFPSFEFSEAFIEKYAEDKIHPMDTVYGYVPIDELARELHYFITK